MNTQSVVSWFLGIVVGAFVVLVFSPSKVKTVEVPSKPRQFVIVVTPNGPVWGEAEEDEDVTRFLHGAEPQKESNKIPAPKAKGTITF